MKRKQSMILSVHSGFGSLGNRDTKPFYVRGSRQLTSSNLTLLELDICELLNTLMWERQTRSYYLL